MIGQKLCAQQVVASSSSSSRSGRVLFLGAPISVTRGRRAGGALHMCHAECLRDGRSSSLRWSKGNTTPRVGYTLSARIMAIYSFCRNIYFQQMHRGPPPCVTWQSCTFTRNTRSPLCSLSKTPLEGTPSSLRFCSVYGICHPWVKNACVFHVAGTPQAQVTALTHRLGAICQQGL